MSAAESDKSKVVLVWGANGISGSALLKELHNLPHDEWSSIIAVSRRPLRTDIVDSRLKFIAVDLLASEMSDVVSRLRDQGGQNVTHVFHYTYVEKNDPDEQVRVNTGLLDTALKASAAVSNKIEVFSLQTGYKYYGVDNPDPSARAPVPFVEDTPRTSFPNFYYHQEDLLRDFCGAHGWNYIVTRPNFIIGVAKGNYMNLAVSLALYAVIQKKLGNPLIFPGNQDTWNGVNDHSDAKNNAAFCLWTIKTPQAHNQAFNIFNGDQVHMRELWPKIADYFGMQTPKEPFQGDSARDTKTPQLNVEEFMKDKAHVWESIVKDKGVEKESFSFATWKFLDFSFGRSSLDTGSLEKARKLGWKVTVDTAKSYFDTFNEMKRLNLIPNEI